MDFNLSVNFDIANSIIDGDSDVEVPDETLMSIDVENLVKSSEISTVSRSTENVSKEGRFNVVSDSEVRKTLKRRIPQNTRKNTGFAMKTFMEWAEFRIKQQETLTDPMGMYEF